MTNTQLLEGAAKAVRDNGASWDYWDGFYKDVMHGKGRLRERLDAAIAAAEFLLQGGGE